MASLPDFTSIIHSPPFTFLIGPSHTKLTIQSALAKHVSPRLDEFMNNGHTRESRHRIAVLEDEDVETFVGFAEYAYTGDYTVPIVGDDLPDADESVAGSDILVPPHHLGAAPDLPPPAPSPPVTERGAPASGGLRQTDTPRSQAFFGGGGNNDSSPADWREVSAFEDEDDNDDNATTAAAAPAPAAQPEPSDAADTAQATGGPDDDESRVGKKGKKNKKGKKDNKKTHERVLSQASAADFTPPRTPPPQKGAAPEQPAEPAAAEADTSTVQHNSPDNNNNNNDNDNDNANNDTIATADESVSGATAFFDFDAPSQTADPSVHHPQSNLSNPPSVLTEVPPYRPSFLAPNIAPTPDAYSNAHADGDAGGAGGFGAGVVSAGGPNGHRKRDLWDQFRGLEYTTQPRRSLAAARALFRRETSGDAADAGNAGAGAGAGGMMAPGEVPFVIFHAKLYVFSTRYTIPALAQLCLQKLHGDLVNFEIGFPTSPFATSASIPRPMAMAMPPTAAAAAAAFNSFASYQQQQQQPGSPQSPSSSLPPALALLSSPHAVILNLLFYTYANTKRDQLVAAPLLPPSPPLRPIDDDTPDGDNNDDNNNNNNTDPANGENYLALPYPYSQPVRQNELRTLVSHFAACKVRELAAFSPRAHIPAITAAATGGKAGPTGSVGAQGTGTPAGTPGRAAQGSQQQNCNYEMPPLGLPVPGSVIEIPTSAGAGVLGCSLRQLLDGVPELASDLVFCMIS